MFQTGPEIHGNGPDLDLRPHGSLSLGEEYRDFHDHMVAAVAVVFGILYIILYAQYSDIILVRQQFCHDIDIVDKGTNHTYTCHVVQLFLNVLFSKVVAQTLKLIIDAQGSLDAAFDGGNGISGCT